MNYENELSEAYRVYTKELLGIELHASKRTVAKLAKIVCDYIQYRDAILGKEILTNSEEWKIIQKIV